MKLFVEINNADQKNVCSKDYIVCLFSCFILEKNVILPYVMGQIFADFTSTFQLLVKGFLIGIIVSAPMGPVGLLCIQRTMQKGRAYGLVTGAGAALSDLFYALVTGAGLSLVMGFIQNEKNLFGLKLIGSVMLFVFGLWVLRTDPRKVMRPSKNNNNKGTLFHNFITSFLVTLSNPLIIFLFLALFNMFTFVIPGNFLGKTFGYISIITGAMIWWLGLTYVVAKMKKNFGLRGILRLNQTIGTTVIIFSLIYAITTVFHLSIY